LASGSLSSGFSDFILRFADVSIILLHESKFFNSDGLKIAAAYCMLEINSRSPAWRRAAASLLRMLTSAATSARGSALGRCST
jgi:hypothetical protein